MQRGSGMKVCTAQIPTPSCCSPKANARPGAPGGVTSTTHVTTSHEVNFTRESYNVSRSQLLHKAAPAAAFALLLLPSLRPRQAAAAVIEEEAAQNIFDSASACAASVHIRLSNGEAEGLGSGIVWPDGRGHVVTNYHVIKSIVSDRSGSKALTVGLIIDETEKSTEYAAEVLQTDADNDLAVLRIDAPPAMLAKVTVGSSRQLRVGQSVFAIGSPFGYGKSLSAGVVSGLNRAIPSPVGTMIRGAIQTDAAISSGNSGGPLLDSRGHLVGVNTSTFTRLGTGRSSGVNFAIPADLLVQVIPAMIVSGTQRSPPPGNS